MMELDDNDGLSIDDSIDLDLELEVQSNSDFDETELDPSRSKSAFEHTTEALLRLGAVPLDRFQIRDGADDCDDASLGDVDVPFGHTLAYIIGNSSGSKNNNNDDNDDNIQPDINIDIPSVSPSDAPKVLRDVARKLFGGSRFAAHAEPLKYEVLETQPSEGEVAAHPKYSCILTLFRPTGSSRSYRTRAQYYKSSEAKAAAAHLALQLGVVEFMKNGDKSRDRIQLVPLGRLGTGVVELEQEQPEERDTVGDMAILDIENCCTEWRSGTVHPQWIYLTDNRFIGSYGCALKIRLSAHVQRAYSVVPGGIVSSSDIISYRTKSHAKSACAKLAVAEGVLDFIKHGDGLEQPVGSGFEHAGTSGPHFGTPAATVLTLQAFYDSLPKPMPDSIGTKMNGDFNAIPWLNNMVQMTKGSRMTSSFHWFTDVKVGLHGCLLRLTRIEGPSKTYMIDACFSKRSDAKVAVCLWACSQGLGTYVQQVAAEIDSLVTPEMRRRCGEELLPALGRALHKVRPGLRAGFGFVCDLASFSCTLTVDLSCVVITPASSSHALPSTKEQNSQRADENETESLREMSTEGTALLSTTTPKHADTEDIKNTITAMPPAELGSVSGNEVQTEPKKTWATRTKSQYKTKQDARVAAICLAFEEGISQWVEGFQGACHGSNAVDGNLRIGKEISGTGFNGSRGLGLGNRGRRRGVPGGGRGQRGFPNGKGFGRGRSGSGGHGHWSTAVSYNRAATTSTNAHPRSGADIADANVVELEEGEMIDGNIDLNSCEAYLGKFENDLLGVENSERMKSVHVNDFQTSMARGTGHGRGRRRDLGSAFLNHLPQKVHSVMPHINPQFFPHLNVIPAYPASYQPRPPPPPPPLVPVLPSGYNYPVSYYNSGTPVLEPNYSDFNDSEWYKESGETFARGSAVPFLYQYGPLHSGNNSSRRQRLANQSAHHSRPQLDTADTVSDAVKKPRLSPSFVEVDKGGAEPGDASRHNDRVGEVVRNESAHESKGKDSGIGQSKGSMSDRDDSSQALTTDGGKDKVTAGSGERNAAPASSTSQRIAAAEAIPSKPRAMLMHTHRSSNGNSRYSISKSKPTNISSQAHYSLEFGHYGQTVVTAPPPPPPPPTYTTGFYQYPYPYQQRPISSPPPHQLNYHPYDYYDQHYHQEAPFPQQMPPYSASSPHSGFYPQPSIYPYPTAYPQSNTSPREPLPPSGPRAMIFRQQNLANVRNDNITGARQPPSAPKAMMQKLGVQQQQGKISKGRQDMNADEMMAFSRIDKKRAREEDTSQSSGSGLDLERKRLKYVS